MERIEVTGIGLDASELRKNWGWFAILGALLVILGAVAIGSSVFVTLASVIFFGWLLVIGGVLEAVHGFARRRWSGFFLDLLFGLLYVIVGFMIIAHPLESAINLTLVIALFLLFGGAFRMVLALMGGFQHSMWLFLHGAISVALGVMIWRRWPLDGLWVIGLFVGIEMMLNGWTMIMLGLAARAWAPPAPAAT